MRITFVRLLVFFASVVAMPALANSSSGLGSESNFSYSQIGVNLGQAMPEEDIVFFGDRYEEFGVASLAGSVQVNSNVALGVGLSAVANEESRTEINNASLVITAQFPIPVGEQVDIVPQVGFGRFETELCLDGFCQSDDDSAAVYSLGLRAWAVPDVLELNAGYFDSNQDNAESSIALGAALWAAEHHRFGLTYEDADSLTAVTVGYSYNW